MAFAERALKMLNHTLPPMFWLPVRQSNPPPGVNTKEDYIAICDDEEIDCERSGSGSGSGQGGVEASEQPAMIPTTGPTTAVHSSPETDMPAVNRTSRTMPALASPTKTGSTPSTSPDRPTQRTRTTARSVTHVKSLQSGCEHNQPNFWTLLLAGLLILQLLESSSFFSSSSLFSLSEPLPVRCPAKLARNC